MIYARLNRLVERGEARFGRFGWLLIVATALMILACIYVRPGTNYIGHGQSFEALTKDPFPVENGNVLAFRVLTPLIAHLIGLQGRPFILLNLIFAWVTIIIIYAHFRGRAQEPADPLVAASIITFSAVILVTIYYAGFCDALTYLAIFLIWRFRRSPLLFYFFFAVGIFNHESVGFLLPWFAFVRMRETAHKWRCVLELIIGFCIVLGPYYYFRQWISSGGNAILSFAHYFNPLREDLLHWIRGAYQFYWLGWFTVFKALWVFPIAAVVSLWKRKETATLWSILIITFCASIQLVIAYDTTRMLTLGFMVMILALLHLMQTNAFEFRRWAVWVILFNLLIPQLYTASYIIEIMTSTPVNLLKMVIEHKPWW